jgi:hypothetical protein
VKRIFSHASLALLEGALIAGLVAALMVGTAFAGRGGGGGGGSKHGSGGTATGSLALAMVDDANGNGAPNWADTITFQVTSSLASPYVSVTCTQNGSLVYSASAGFYADFPWPGAQNMPLSSPSWTGGAASCKAVLENTSTVLSFSVGA